MTKSKTPNKISAAPPAAQNVIAPPYLNPKLRTVWNYKLGDSEKDLEELDPVSITVPDMTMSLKELLHRHSRGLPVPTLPNPQYSEVEFPDLDRLDLSQIQELRENNARYIEELTEQQQQIVEKQRELKNALVPVNKAQNDDLPPEVV